MSKKSSEESKPKTRLGERRYSGTQSDTVYEAVRSKDIAKVDAAVQGVIEFLKKNSDYDRFDYRALSNIDGESILHIAAETGDVGMFREMAKRYEHQKKEEVVDSHQRTVMFSAVISGNPDMVKVLHYGYGMAVRGVHSDDDGKTLMNVAAACGHCEMFKMLAKEKEFDLPVQTQIPLKETVLYSAIIGAKSGEIEGSSKSKMVGMLVMEYGFSRENFEELTKNWSETQLAALKEASGLREYFEKMDETLASQKKSKVESKENRTIIERTNRFLTLQFYKININCIFDSSYEKNALRDQLIDAIIEKTNPSSEVFNKDFRSYMLQKEFHEKDIGEKLMTTLKDMEILDHGCVFSSVDLKGNVKDKNFFNNIVDNFVDSLIGEKSHTSDSKAHTPTGGVSATYL